MIDSTDMTTPVTRGELQDTLGLFQQGLRIEHQQELRAAVAPLATRTELRDEIQAATAELRDEIRTATAPLVTRTELRDEIQAATAPLVTRTEFDATVAQLATKAELQAAIAPLATKAELQAAIAPLATKAELASLAAELEMWGGALVARIQHGEQRLDKLELGQQQLTALIQQTRQDLEQSFTAGLQQTEQRLMQELSRHTSAILESMQTQIKACFEPHADLPERVQRLEGVVFRPRPRAARRRKN